MNSSPEPRVTWAWRPRQGVTPAAAVGWGPAAVRLHAWLARRERQQLAPLRASAASDVLFVAGPAASLPWVDGIAYAAPCEQAPALWLPTLWEPDVPADLLARALLRRHPCQPLLLWPQPATLITLHRQAPVDAAWLAHVAGAWQGVKAGEGAIR